MSFKNSSAARTTVTRDTVVLEHSTGNIYESAFIIAKRANQISQEIKEELSAKLQEFASHTDNLEEIFENREQIEISKHYEKMPKPVAIAIDEFANGKVYFRKTGEETAK
ncbi:MAG TPA: DNA-directed RNA polymerase subunit omega [Luteibaculaceae bacterium]|nr:DNA-directed RNA polymerase subunit omega [Luteibaculaceae bacterium]